jgi:hypothetical protein
MTQPRITIKEGGGSFFVSDRCTGRCAAQNRIQLRPSRRNPVSEVSEHGESGTGLSQICVGSAAQHMHQEAPPDTGIPRS